MIERRKLTQLFTGSLNMRLFSGQRDNGGYSSRLGMTFLSLYTALQYKGWTNIL